jgi:hypothetical protein
MSGKEPANAAVARTRVLRRTKRFIITESSPDSRKRKACPVRETVLSHKGSARNGITEEEVRQASEQFYAALTRKNHTRAKKVAKFTA